MLKEMTATASQGARRGTAVATVPSRMGSIVSAFLTRRRLHPMHPEPSSGGSARPNGAARDDLTHGPANENSDRAAPRLTPEVFGYHPGVKVPRRKRRDAGKPRRVHRHLGQPAELILELAAIPNADALLRWTITTLPIRNALPDHAKQLLEDHASSGERVGADPDLLAAISKPSRPPPHDRPTAQP